MAAAVLNRRGAARLNVDLNTSIFLSQAS